MHIQHILTRACTNPQGKTDSVEPWYRTEYSQQPIAQDWLRKWGSTQCKALHLPKLNPFIPTDFGMLQVLLPCAPVWFSRVAPTIPAIQHYVFQITVVCCTVLGVFLYASHLCVRFVVILGSQP